MASMLFIQVQFPCGTQAPIDSKRLDDLLGELAQLFTDYEVTLQAGVTEMNSLHGSGNGDWPNFTPSYCKTALDTGMLVPSVLIELYYKGPCPDYKRRQEMQSTVCDFVFGKQCGSNSAHVIIHPAVIEPGVHKSAHENFR